MSTIRTLRFLVVLAAIATDGAEAQAQVPPCGTVLTHSVQLQSDLHCPPGVDAYAIGADDVSIDLNGFGIYGTRGEGFIRPIGIRSTGASRFTMKGPGRIDGFYLAVSMEGGDDHIVSNVDMIGSEFGLSYLSTTRSTVEYSRATWFTLRSTPSALSTGNIIVGNRGNISLQGCLTFENVVAKNQVGSPRASGFVNVQDGPYRNRLEGNQVLGQVVLMGARENAIIGNQVEDTNQMATSVMLATGLDPCAGFAPIGSVANEVFANDFSNGNVGVIVAGDPALGVVSHSNAIRGNAIRDMRSAGLVFTRLADDNDATGNAYANVPRYAVDQGLRNLWP